MNELNFAGSKVLVVGGAGFVGSNLVKMLLSCDAEKIDVVDNLLSSEKENLPDNKRVDLRIGSIAHDPVLDFVKDDYDYIFHVATYHGNQSSIHDPIKDHENNTLTTLKLFWHIREFKKLKKIVYTGAGCSVAEKNVDTACATDEDAPIKLTMDSPYSISKVIGEFYSAYFYKQHNLPVVTARFQNVYGPGEILGAGQWRGTPATVWRNVTPTFIYKALNKESLPLQNEGKGTRDFIYVDDICRGLMACALRGEAGEIFNLASGVETSIAGLAEMINRLTGNDTPVELQPRRDWDTSIARYGSTKKAEDKIGFKAEVNLEEGLANTVKWTRENIGYIKSCIKKHDKYMIIG